MGHHGSVPPSRASCFLFLLHHFGSPLFSLFSLSLSLSLFFVLLPSSAHQHAPRTGVFLLSVSPLLFLSVRSKVAEECAATRNGPRCGLFRDYSFSNNRLFSEIERDRLFHSEIFNFLAGKKGEKKKKREEKIKRKRGKRGNGVGVFVVHHHAARGGTYTTQLKEG